MATIRTAIELQDNFTSVLYQVVNSVNLSLSTMEELNQTMNSPINTASIEGARNAIDQATIAVLQLDTAMKNMENPSIQAPTVRGSVKAYVTEQPQLDFPDDLTINISVVDDVATQRMDALEQQLQGLITLQDAINTTAKMLMFYQITLPMMLSQ